MIRHRRARTEIPRREWSFACGAPTASLAIAGPRPRNSSRDWARPISPATEALDPARIDHLRSTLGSARLGGLVDLLCADCAERPVVLHAAERRGDLIAVRAEARALLGAATGVGAGALGEAAQALQSVSALAFAAPLIEALDAAARETLRAARRLLDQLSD